MRDGRQRERSAAESEGQRRIDHATRDAIDPCEQERAELGFGIGAVRRLRPREMLRRQILDAIDEAGDRLRMQCPPVGKLDAAGVSVVAQSIDDPPAVDELLRRRRARRRRRRAIASPRAATAPPRRPDGTG